MSRQRLTRAISAVASSAGVAVFSFEYVPTSLHWTVTLNIPSAPSGAESTAVAGGSTYGQWRGSNSWGPLLIGNGEQLTVTTTGLLPGVQYVLQAVGFAQTEGTPDYTYPLAYADTVTTSIEDLFIGSVQDVTSWTVSVPISPAWRSLWVAVAWTNAATDTIKAVGDQSGIELQSFQPPYFKSASDVFYRYPLIAGLDTSITLTMTSSASFSAWWGADLSDIDIATYSTIAEVLGLSYQASTTGITYAIYTGVEGDGYTFTNVPSGTATVDVTIAAATPPGEVWTASTLPSSASWTACSISGSNAVAVPLATATAAYSTNGGQTWTAATLPSSTGWHSCSISGSNAVAVASGTNAAAYSIGTASPLPGGGVTISCIGETSLTTYGSVTVTTPGVQTISLPVIPMIDSEYFLVAPPADVTYWTIPVSTGDILAQAAYVSTTAPQPNTNIVTITYQIFTPQPSIELVVTDSLGNTVGTVSLATSPGIYTAHLSYATPTSTNLIASAPESNAYWKIYSWVASN